MDPIVVLISSYKEGELIRGAIRSACTCHPVAIFVYDGPTSDRSIPGEETSLGPLRGPVHSHFGRWESEHEKRTAMIGEARQFLYGGDFWILTLDADEILVWGEYLPDWIGQLRPDEGERVIPIKRTEAAWDPESGFVSDVAPSRLLHSSMVKRYLTSCWRMETMDGQTFEASHYRAPRQPMYGEPHIHHRHYLRRMERGEFREHLAEEAEYTEELRRIGEIIPSPEAIDEIVRGEHDQA